VHYQCKTSGTPSKSSRHRKNEEDTDQKQEATKKRKMIQISNRRLEKRRRYRSERGG